MLKTPPRRAGPLAVQRARVQAERDSAERELEALAAEEAAQRARAEAEAARREAAQQRDQAAYAALAPVVAEICAPTRAEELERAPTYEEWCRQRDRQEEMMRQLRELANSPLPHVPMTREEQRELRAELDAALAASEHTGDLFYDSTTGRLWARSRFY